MKHSSYFRETRYRYRQKLDLERNRAQVEALKQLYGDKDVKHSRTDTNGAARTFSINELGEDPTSD